VHREPNMCSGYCAATLLASKCRTPRRPWWGSAGRCGVGDPGDDRLSRLRTIMGLAGLTAVFGMGTGVAPPVWSPGKRHPGGQARASRWIFGNPVSHAIRVFGRDTFVREGRRWTPRLVAKDGPER
jgi:hypothetical protein